LGQSVTTTEIISSMTPRRNRPWEISDYPIAILYDYGMMLLVGTGRRDQRKRAGECWKHSRPTAKASEEPRHDHSRASLPSRQVDQDDPPPGHRPGPRPGAEPGPPPARVAHPRLPPPPRQEPS